MLHTIFTPLVRAKSEAKVDLKSVEEVPGDKFAFAKPKGVGATLLRCGFPRFLVMREK